MPKSILALALGLIVPLGAHALEVLSIDRAVRVVDPANSFFVFDQRSSSFGVFDVASSSRPRGSVSDTARGKQVSDAAFAANALRLGSPSGSGRAQFTSVAVVPQAIVESWVRVDFLVTGRVGASATFNSWIPNNFLAFMPVDAVQMSLRDVTSGTTVFEFDPTDYRSTGTLASESAVGWSGSLRTGHAYAFDFTMLASVSTLAEAAEGALAFRIQDSPAAPVPEPATGAMMLAGLALAAGALRRRAKAATAPRRD